MTAIILIFLTMIDGGSNQFLNLHNIYLRSLKWILCGLYFTLWSSISQTKLQTVDWRSLYTIQTILSTIYTHSDIWDGHFVEIQGHKKRFKGKICKFYVWPWAYIILITLNDKRGDLIITRDFNIDLLVTISPIPQHSINLFQKYPYQRSFHNVQLH